MKLKRTLITLLALIAALLGARAAEAQQVCYANDGLGRLTGVINESNQAAFYDYDAVGNILSIRRQSPTGPVTVFSFDPPGGLPGSKVEVFGVGFSTTANQNTVTLGGVPATVLSTLPCTLIVQVPANVTSGPISVTSPLGIGTSLQSFMAFGLTLAPTTPRMFIGATQQFSVLITGCQSVQVVWSVNGIVGGNTTVGTITPSGLYTAPNSVPIPTTVTVRVDSVGCPGFFADRLVTVTDQLGFVFAHASASHGFITPSVPFPADIIFHRVSISNVPVIATLSPTNADVFINPDLTITITGENLTGAMNLRFMDELTGYVSTDIIARNVIVNPTGTVLTADVSIFWWTPSGNYIVVVQATAGNSTTGSTGVNNFTVTP